MFIYCFGNIYDFGVVGAAKALPNSIKNVSKEHHTKKTQKSSKIGLVASATSPDKCIKKRVFALYFSIY